MCDTKLKRERLESFARHERPGDMTDAQVEELLGVEIQEGSTTWEEIIEAAQRKLDELSKPPPIGDTTYEMVAARELAELEGRKIWLDGKWQIIEVTGEFGDRIEVITLPHSEGTLLLPGAKLVAVADEEEEGWSAKVVADSFNLSIKLGNAAMETRDDVAKALRELADTMQGNIELDGRIHDDNGNGVGWWAYEDDPRSLSGDCFAFRGKLEVYAADADEAKELAKEVCEFIAEPVSFGCTANVGGEQAPPALKLPAIHGYQEGC